MTADVLAGIAGVALSLAFSYVPGLATWYNDQEGTYKRLVMLVALILAAGGLFAMACAGWLASFGLALTCDQAGALELVRIFLVALIANQSVDRISPRVGAKTPWYELTTKAETPDLDPVE